MLNKSLDFLIINFLSYNSRWGGSLFLCVGNCLANCGRMARYSAMVTMESLHEITTIADLLRPAIPQRRSQMHRAWPTARCVLPPGKYDRRYRQDFFCIHIERCCSLPQESYAQKICKSVHICQTYNETSNVFFRLTVYWNRNVMQTETWDQVKLVFQQPTSSTRFALNGV